MRKIALILTFLTSLNFLAQEFPDKIFFDNYVECYYSKKLNEPIFIYDSPNGNKIGKLNPLTEKHCWYKFAITDSKNGWLKIENLLALPGCGENEIKSGFQKYKHKWIIAKNMIINIGHSGETKINCLVDKKDKGFNENGYTFYSKPNSNSKIEFCVKGYTRSELIGINGTWAQLKIVHNSQTYIGWLPRKYQCAYPWTTCPVYD